MHTQDAEISKRLPSLSLFFPLYNEEGNVGELMQECATFVAGYSADVEIIFINDGSRDGTAARIDAFAGQYPFVKAIHHEKNRGYGAALQSGFEAATRNVVFFTDGDCQFKLNHLREFIDEILKGADVVVGYRENRKDSGMRLINAWAWGRLVSFLFGIKVRDVDCAYKMFRRTTVRELNLRATGALVSTEMLARIVAAKERLVELPVHHFPRKAGKSTGANIGVVVWAFVELFKLYGRIRFPEKKYNVRTMATGEVPL